MAQRLVRIRSEESKSRKDRVLPFSKATAALLYQYQDTLPGDMSDDRGIFLSESDRNAGASMSTHGWRKVVECIRNRAKLPKLHAHTLRHLGLTDLARSGMTLLDLKEFAGHSSIRHTQIYITLGAKEIQEAL